MNEECNNIGSKVTIAIITSILCLVLSIVPAAFSVFYGIESVHHSVPFEIKYYILPIAVGIATLMIIVKICSECIRPNETSSVIFIDELVTTVKAMIIILILSSAVLIGIFLNKELIEAAWIVAVSWNPDTMATISEYLGAYNVPFTIALVYIVATWIFLRLFSHLLNNKRGQSAFYEPLPITLGSFTARISIIIVALVISGLGEEFAKYGLEAFQRLLINKDAFILVTIGVLISTMMLTIVMELFLRVKKMKGQNRHVKQSFLAELLFGLLHDSVKFTIVAIYASIVALLLLFGFDNGAEITNMVFFSLILFASLSVFLGRTIKQRLIIFAAPTLSLFGLIFFVSTLLVPILTFLPLAVIFIFIMGAASNVEAADKAKFSRLVNSGMSASEAHEVLKAKSDAELYDRRAKENEVTFTGMRNDQLARDSRNKAKVLKSKY
ncbi:hypothetical protein EKG38_10775 [Shewanella canadensis]|uniref:Uncharacterized protein n=1 Tax=Shewanella canadensis TaxID=271096 RepID=A0A3S0ISE3_9GAMM|nr:hypothetical protein [Shewanella canadensis]RTR38655.1 hypothetical protein EKG38_10775 [Shewanella canadensis]